METQKHIWHFETIGGVKRVNLNSGADLLALDTLDQKLWTALSCPVKGLEIDPHTLQLIDTNNDKQIRVPEILAAVKWILSILKNPDDLLAGSSILYLNAINVQSTQGAEIYASARTILNNLGKAEQNFISIEDTLDTVQIFAGTSYNGDGIITTDSTQEESLQKLIETIIFSLGAKQDRGGKLGIDTELIQTFFEACQNYYNWQMEAEEKATEIMPFGTNTPHAYESFLAVKSKIDDYFIRCNLAAFDIETTQTLNQLNDQVAGIAQGDLSKHLEAIKNYPLAKIEGGKALSLMQGINPVWQNEIAQFSNAIFGSNQNHLTEIEWKKINAKFDAYLFWRSKEIGTQVAYLGLEKMKEIIEGNAKALLLEIVAHDYQVSKEAESIMLVNQLVHYNRDLFTLLRNFVSFNDFYMPGKKAIFQAGTLFIDQRSCDLCLKVNDMDRHNSLVSYSGMFLIYCKCVSKSTAQEMIIVAALTNGDIDNLIVGRNALFYDRSGQDWDATIIKIIDNPISIRQAFFTPYRKISIFISTQINNFTAAQDNKVQNEATSSISKTAEKAEEHTNGALNKVEQSPEKPAAPATPFDIGKFVGIFAAISLALGALGGALASIIGGFMALTWWKIPLAIVGIILLISGPSMLIAYLKLRKRNLAPLLDANGWAINARATVNIKFGNLLTQIASIPLNAELNLNDPFSKKGIVPWKVAFIIGFGIGVILFLLSKFWFKYF
ncbi:MAG: hypothetical protein ACOVK9_03385 [Bacteroidia bacterium]